jgi:hypothetical protein
MKDFSSVRRYTFYQEYGNGVQEDEPNGDSVDYEDYSKLLSAYDGSVRENLALKKLLDRAHSRLDEMKQG